MLSWLVLCIGVARTASKLEQGHPHQMTMLRTDSSAQDRKSFLDAELTGLRSLQDVFANRSLADVIPFYFKVWRVANISQEPQFPKHGPLSQEYATLPFAREHIQKAPREIRYFMIPVAVCAFIFTSIIVGKLAYEHMAEGERRRERERKVFRPKATNCIIYVILLFPVISFTSCMALIAPRNSVLLLIVARTYEAIALFAFFELLVCMMGDPEEAVSQMEREEPFRIYGMPPLCCCYCFVPRMTMNRNRFLVARNLVLQYCVVAPLATLLNAWNNGYVPWDGSREPKQVVAGLLVSRGAKVASTLLCFWGLFQLYKATHFRLEQLETTKKFALIKIMLVLCEAVHLVKYIASQYYDFSDDTVYTDEVMVDAWGQMGTCLLLAPLACFVPAAFPVKDLDFLDERLQLWSLPSSHLSELK